jgi:hypothetical protein
MSAPLDLDAYLASYTGVTQIQRALFVVRRADSRDETKLATEALQRCSELIAKTTNIRLYKEMVALAEFCGLAVPTDIIDTDALWMVRQTTLDGLNKALVEHKKQEYADKIVQTLIQIGDVHYNTGSWADAIQSYQDANMFFPGIEESAGKELAFVKNNLRVATTCIYALHSDLYAPLRQVTREQHRFTVPLVSHRLGPSVSRNAYQRSDGFAIANNCSDKIREALHNVRSLPQVLKAHPGLELQAQILNGMWVLFPSGERKDPRKVAANLFSSIPAAFDVDAGVELLSAQGITTYACMFGLRSFSRQAINETLLGIPSVQDVRSGRTTLDSKHTNFFSQCLAAVLEMRRVVQHFQKSEFALLFKTLNQIEHQFFTYDLYAPYYIQQTLQDIFQKALIQYLKPFQAVTLQHLAEVFDRKESRVEADIARLNEQGIIQARIDLASGVVIKQKVDEREEAYQAALSTAELYIRQTKASILQASCISQNLVVTSISRQDLSLAEEIAGGSSIRRANGRKRRAPPGKQDRY